MKPGADQEFVDLVEKYGKDLSVSVERLGPNCRATHVVRIDQSSLLLPVKLQLESPKQAWFLNNEYKGVLLLVIKSNKTALIIHTSEINPSGIRTSTMLNRYQDRLCPLSISFIRKLRQAFEVYDKCEISAVLNDTKCTILSREQALLKGSSCALEANANEEIQDLLHDGFLHLTPEKCHADAGYNIKQNDLVLPIQTKSASINSDTGRLSFAHTSGYDDMILMCRPMTRLYIGTFVIPGISAPDQLNIYFSGNSIYAKYLVSDIDLSIFMQTLYTAIARRDETCIWPSKAVINISSISLKTLEAISIPRYKTDIAENEFATWRKESFSLLTFAMPKVQGTTVDTIINGVRCQDKISQVKKYRLGFSCSMHKNNGRINGRSYQSKAPYAQGDFDALFVFSPDKKWIFLIPATELVSRGYLKTKNQPGKIFIMLYATDYRYTANGYLPDLWTQKYCFSMKDLHVQDEVAIALQSCLPTSS